ncbi:MAG: hypothetical protein VB878_10590 [Pirellulaceae bacterium]
MLRVERSQKPAQQRSAWNCRFAERKVTLLKAIVEQEIDATQLDRKAAEI